MGGIFFGGGAGFGEGCFGVVVCLLFVVLYGWDYFFWLFVCFIWITCSHYLHFLYYGNGSGWRICFALLIVE